MERDQKTEMLPGTLEMLILKALERNDQPMHGYGIALYLKQISKDVLQVEEGSLYPHFNASPSKAGSRPSGASPTTIAAPASTS